MPRKAREQFNELLWPFTQLPDHYVVLDTETTGLISELGYPDLLAIGLTTVRNRKVYSSNEWLVRPARSIGAEAQLIHGITDEKAKAFPSLAEQWGEIRALLDDSIVAIHNASFDWPILIDQLKRHELPMPTVKGVFCSQKAAMSWAQANGLEVSSRGPSLDTLTKVLALPDLREINNGVHTAAGDSVQAAGVIEALRRASETSNAGSSSH